MPCGHGCCETYREHVASIGFAASAMPTRHAHVAATEQREKALSRDRAAYKRLRDDGLQPRSVRGADRLEKHADHRLEVESGRLLADIT